MTLFHKGKALVWIIENDTHGIYVGNGHWSVNKSRRDAKQFVDADAAVGALINIQESKHPAAQFAYIRSFWIEGTLR